MSAPASKESTRIDYSLIARALANEAERVAEHLWPAGKRVSGNWCVGDVHGTPAEGDGSFRVALQGSKSGLCKDFASDEKGMDLLDAWAKSRGISKREAAEQASNFLGLRPGDSPPSRPPKKKKPKQVVEDLGFLNLEFNQRLRKRLSENKKALSYLHNRGITDATIAEFRMGLSYPYKDKEGIERQKALQFPLRRRDGRFAKKYGYYNVPGVSQNPLDDNGWMSGSPQCYFADVVQGQRCLFVCEGIKDVWRHWQALKEDGLDDEILIVSSTHGSGVPEPWKDPDFWNHWDVVYFGHDNDQSGDKTAERLLEYVCREVRRVRVPQEHGKDWTDFWQSGGTVAQFRQLLETADRVMPRIQEATGDPQQTGRMSLAAVDVNNAFHNGFLYYPTEVLRREWVTDEAGEQRLAEWAETIVIRSDRTSCSITEAYAPSALRSARGRRGLLKLTDGTILKQEPQSSAYHTWEWSSIQAYLEKREKVRPLREIVEEINGVLRRSVWLPYEEDYSVLALMIPVTYVQRVFDAVPLFLMNGPPGSGKTQTAKLVAKMACNGNVVGQVSAASVARHIDGCRGFVVLDDLEAIGSKGQAEQFSELVQALKVSYNRDSAKKMWTDVKTMRVHELDFFGVKMINNTKGVDAILASRMIKIQTRPAPEAFGERLKELAAQDEQRLREIRQELHTWAFVNVGAVHQRYIDQYHRHHERAEEIAAPLRVMADMIGNDQIRKDLESALARQSSQLEDPDDPREVMREAVRNLIRHGYERVSLTHVSLEMRSLLEANFGQSSTTEIPEWSRPEWVGRQLRNEDLVDLTASAGRQRLFGKSLRLVQLAEWLIEEVHNELKEAGRQIEVSQSPVNFCRGCEQCPYRNAGCEIMAARQKAENRAKAH